MSVVGGESAPGSSRTPHGEREPSSARLVDRWRHAVANAARPSVRSLRPAPGLTLGRYTLVAEVGRGGMAAVWLGYCEPTPGERSFVAVKVLLPHLAADHNFVRMLLDEARVLSRIRHPNVVSILDVGAEEGLPWLALEWVPGDSLRRLIDAHPDARVPVPHVLRIVGEACRGLHAAHELRDRSGVSLQVVHRDVSPANILVSALGEVKLIDFGIAQTVDRLASRTEVGVIKGKMAYVAPERLRGGEADRRGDVWSMGVVLYRLLAGRLHHEGDVMHVMEAVSNGVPHEPLPDEVPASLRAVVDRALSLDPSLRYASASELRRAVQLVRAELVGTDSREHFAAYVSAQLADRLAEHRLLAERVDEPG